MASKKNFGFWMAIGAVVGGGLTFILKGGVELPQIKIFNAAGQQTGTIPVGQTYTVILTGFPANTQLVSARNITIAGGDLVALGTTGANGVLTLSNLTAVGTGTYYIYAHDAPTGKYCAVTTLIVV